MRETVDLLLVNPGNRVEQFANLAPLATVAQPLGIAMLAAYVREQGISVAIFDAEAYGLTPVEAADQIEALYNPPLLVGLSAFTTKMTSAGHIMQELKRRWPETKMMCGGHHPSAIPERTLREEATDYVIKGEGFYPVTELMQRLKKGEHCYDIKGVWLWRPDGTVHPGGQAPGPQKLDELPPPAYDLLPMKQYKAHHWQAWGRGEIDTTGFSLIHTSLGCPFTCLTGDTLVNTRRGDIAIKELAEHYRYTFGEVFSYRSEKVFVTDAFNVRKTGVNKSVVRVNLSNGNHIDCTPEHKFKCGSEEVEAQHLRPDRLLVGRHLPVYVKSVVPLPDKQDVYCMEVPSTGWFFANDVLVHNCSYCSVNVVYERHTVRYRSPVKVADEIEHLINVYGVQHFEFIDDTFTTNRKHVEAICDEIISRGLGDKVNAWAFSRVDRADPRFLAKMKAAGINWVFMGLESGNDTVLLGVDKGQSVADIREAVDKVHAAGIHIGGNYVFGLPEDTHASMDQTFALARDLNTEYANFFIMMSYPGSFMHDALPPADALPKKWSQYGFFAPDALPLRNATVSAADILERRDRAFKEYFGGERYQNMVEQKFGAETLEFLRSQVLSKQLVRQRTVV